MKQEIEIFFKGEVENSDEVLSKYSKDASVFSVRPELVVFPKDSEDVKNLVKWVSENKEKYPSVAIIARCAGTCMSGGSIGESIIMDFTRHMNKVISFDDKSSSREFPNITVEPGMFYRDFEKVTLERNLVLPCFTASKDINAVGGMYGNNSAGERTLKYGKTEDYIMEARVVFPDGNEYLVRPLTETELNEKINQNDFEGNVYKNIYNLIKENEEELTKAKPNVHKNSAGYYIWNVWNKDTKIFDLNKLLVGSQGTLGIVTEITFKLVKPQEHRKLLVVFMRDITLLPEIVNRTLKYKPQTLESYDDKTFFLVLKYFIGFAKLLGLKNLVKLIFSFGPETVMTLRHGFPKLILLVEFTGETQEEADKSANDALAELKIVKKIGTRLVTNEFEAKKYWTIRHQAFNLIRYHLKKTKSEPFIDDVIVRPEMLPVFLPALYQILNKYKSKMTFAVGGHAGDGNLHIYTLIDPHEPTLKQMIFDVSEQVFDLVVKLEGSITAEHNDGLIRTIYLKKMFNEKTLSIFKEIKNTFDPKNIFNPGKKVDFRTEKESKEYISAHISTV